MFLGRISYALYLWHRPMLVWFSRGHVMQQVGTQPGTILALLCTIAVATGSYYVVERPFLRLKWRLSRVPSHDQPIAQAVTA